MTSPLLIIPLIFLCYFSSPLSSSVVTYLPGFQGPLPFYLETGYVEVDEEHGSEFFYYFIESEKKPAEDPLLLWLTGGPRCSAFTGLAMEVGPLEFVSAEYNGSLPSLVYRSYSWTKVANMIFLDSPSNAGFSYSTQEEENDSSWVQQVYNFLIQWLIEHTQFISNPLYIAGDSYAGKIVPMVAKRILDGIDEGKEPLLNLQILEVYCPASPLNHPQPVSTTSGKRILKENQNILNPPPFPDISCRSYVRTLAYYWANNNIVRKALNIRNGTIKEWVRCNRRLPYTKDYKSNIKYHLSLLQKGYRALVYSGDHDSVIPFSGTKQWIKSLNSSIVEDWRSWHVGGQVAGYTMTYSNNLTFATVKGAGHSAPEYKPQECLAMFRRWISGAGL